MRKIYVSKRTKLLIVIAAIVFFFGGAILASGHTFAEFFSGFWKRFLDLVSGHIR